MCAGNPQEALWWVCLLTMDSHSVETSCSLFYLKLGSSFLSLALPLRLYS